jgi:hypothetical protein
MQEPCIITRDGLAHLVHEIVTLVYADDSAHAPADVIEQLFGDFKTHPEPSHTSRERSPQIMVREILDPALVERFLASAEVISRIERCLETGRNSKSSAWKAAALPLSYTRDFNNLSRDCAHSWPIVFTKINEVESSRSAAP